MNAGTRNFMILLGGVVATLGAVGIWIVQRNERLENERREALAERSRWEQLQASAKSTSDVGTAAIESGAQPNASREELDRLRAEVPALAAELNHRKDALAQEIEKRKAELAANNAAPKKATAPVRAPGPWTNAGRAQPDATFQSVLWAIEGGEVAALSEMIALDREAQSEADRFFAALPAEMRATYRDARSLVASMMAAEISPNAASMQATAQKPLPDGDLLVSVQLSSSNPAAKPKTSNLRFRQSAGGWQLLVPAKVIEGYRYLIAAPPPAP